MEPVSDVKTIRSSSVNDQAGEEALAAFYSKAMAGGDFLSECMALFAQDSALQARSNIQGIKIQQREINRLRKKRMKFLKQRLEATKKSGFWGKFKRAFATIAGVVTAGLSLFCPPLAVGLAGVGVAAASGGFGAMGAHYSKKAMLRSADILLNEQRKEMASDLQDELVTALQAAAQAEQRMLARISSMTQISQANVITG